MKKQNLLIGGREVETTRYTPLIAPYSKETIAEIADGGLEEANLAIEAAAAAKPLMRKMPAHKRAAILEKLARLLTERREEAARLIAREAAKPLKAAYGEVDRTIQTYQFAAEEAKRIHGETIPLDAAPGGEGRFGYTVREPIGVVGAITPFNFPMNLVAHKLGPAIASGNTIVLKPAPQTPLSAYFIADLLKEAGLPDGALNVITGDGKLLGEKIVTDPRVGMITFTGSAGVGTSIRAMAGLKRVTLELGSNAAVIIDRGTDLDTIVPRCAVGAFSNQGQVCISLQRIYVMEEAYEAFVEKFVAAVQALKVGDPLDADTDVSALIADREAARALDWIEEARSLGASVACGGTAENGVLQPTVLLNVPSPAQVSCKEVFAPVVLINKVNSIEEAIERVNDSSFGLQAGIYTNDLKTAMDAAEQLHVGGVMINDIPTFRVDHMPYGGVKESGIGREGIKYAIEDMTELKLVIFNRN
ncbi:acyl-CoA reductase-like NAD-dependent aldehyde dehydrogenase [Paenibacillus phyllosphaerae]|uniref:Acyl-CoA reductase-like NAD-dependent aldehyde dehydrogenase n=1 Tax=Paenibacillus phyllosphaerae TaxID=274593 RepID=A0A7W5FL57_9BACL|nr:aldehyde dehydrogenase family protein [Paenibacillus phyllosphaerae]MBB3108642.1 acyl-CoA reductase-like NAD-dependent aldehyde dehydrogenase [Paenibacillus phyllosphaerae]